MSGHITPIFLCSLGICVPAALGFCILEKLMDNQHKKITGYRDLTQSEIDGMNSIKALEADAGELFK